ncbi:hypothetical protein EII17_13765 [Clostridiales bacterium COT073_COT-073]|nr:hypothetical protein EII17_13765 [Clostridiales bacterium COT073_COT-073]
MIKVGAVNIDTSHPMGFAESMIKDGRLRYIGVFNDSFRDDKEVEGFIKRFNLEKRCDSIEELADLCDIGFIQGCNWDDHLRFVQPFIERDKPVFLDKPIVGNYQDCCKIRQLLKQGAKIIGSSSARYAYEIQDFFKQPLEERGEIITVIGTCGVDDFNYGIHIVEAIGGILGAGAESTSYIGMSNTETDYVESYLINYKNDKTAIYHICTGIWQPFSITIMTTKSTYQFMMDPMRLYDALIEQIANYMESKKNLLVDMNYILESVEIRIAGKQSKEEGGKKILLSKLDDTSPAFNGKEFWKYYSQSSKPLYTI